MDATLSTTKKISDLITGINNGSIIFDPPFQRRKIWSNKDKAFLIDTILKKLPFPEIYVATGDLDIDTGESNLLIVDGQQRISTICDYFHGQLSLSKNGDVPPYKSLTPEQKRDFLNYVVAIRDLKTIGKPEMIEVFRRLNVTSYDANAMEVSNALYSGPLKTFAEKLSQHAFFEENRFFTAGQIRRMGDTRFALTIIITMMNGYFNRDDLLEEYLIANNEEFSEEKNIAERCEKVFQFISDMGMNRKSKFWKQTDFFAVFVELDRVLSIEKIKSIEEGPTSTLLNEFYSNWDNDIDESSLEIVRIYDRASISAANDRKNRVRRGKVIKSIIIGVPLKEADIEALR